MYICIRFNDVRILEHCSVSQFGYQAFRVRQEQYADRSVMSEVNEYSLKDIKEHNSAKSTFLVIYDKVYDVTKFLEEVCIAFSFSCRLLFWKWWWVGKLVIFHFGLLSGLILCLPLPFMVLSYARICQRSASREV